jgi:hypothetical protein
VPFFWIADNTMHNQGYEFWRLLADAMRLCGAKTTADGMPEFD